MLARLLGVPEVRPGAALLPALVVFLVALPLSLGVAMASGVPPAAGLWSAVIGGLVVGRLAGAELQVTGPAAGLAVLVWEIVQTHGLAGLGVVVFLAGALQLLAGVLNLGQWFRAVSPAVVRGMLAGIGLLIFASQLHIVLGSRPTGSGLGDWLALPGALLDLTASDRIATGLVGALAIVAIALWDARRPPRFHSLPGALVGVALATGVAFVFGLSVPTVTLPSDLVAAIDWLTPSEVLGGLTDTGIWASAATLAAVASAEALLSATATDRLHSGRRTDYDQELRAQGVGNLVAGVFGALPVTGVIVRSSANVAAGAKDRLPGMLHASLILSVVLLAPAALQIIPTAALAAVLVVTGVRLMAFKEVVGLYRVDRIEAGILTATALSIVTIDLLTGVVVGIVLSVVRLMAHAIRLELELHLNDVEQHAVVRLSGAGSFLAVSQLCDTLAQVPEGYTLQLEDEELHHVDLAFVDLISNWASRRETPDAHLEQGLGRLRQRVLATSAN